MPTTVTPPRHAPALEPSPLDALIEEARRRQRQRRLMIAAVLLVAAAGAGIFFGLVRDNGRSTSSSGNGSERLCVQNEPGWKSRTIGLPGTPPGLLLTNFHFGRVDYLYGHTDNELRWPRGGILISIANWTSSATTAMEPQYRPASTLSIASSDFTSFEGVSDLGQQHFRLKGQLLEVWVQARPTNASTIAAANRELSNVRVCG